MSHLHTKAHLSQPKYSLFQYKTKCNKLFLGKNGLSIPENVCSIIGNKGELFPKAFLGALITKPFGVKTPKIKAN